MKEYEIVFNWSDEDEAWIALVPNLEGCISHGDTLVQAAQNIEIAIELYLTSTQKHGDKL